MHQIEALNRTRAGTDGPVYFYPYLDSDDIVLAEEEVAKGKSCLVKNLFAQVIYFLLVAAFLISSPSKDDIMYRPGIFFVIFGFISYFGFVSVTLGPAGDSKRGIFLSNFLHNCTLHSAMFTYALIGRHIGLLLNMKEVSSSLVSKLSFFAIAAAMMDSTGIVYLITVSLWLRMVRLELLRWRATHVRIRIR